jgi:hypothetical protein
MLGDTSAAMTLDVYADLLLARWVGTTVPVEVLSELLLRQVKRGPTVRALASGDPRWTTTLSTRRRHLPHRGCRDQTPRQPREAIERVHCDRAWADRFRPRQQLTRQWPRRPAPHRQRPQAGRHATVESTLCLGTRRWAVGSSLSHPFRWALAPNTTIVTARCLRTPHVLSNSHDLVLEVLASSLTHPIALML